MIEYSQLHGRDPGRDWPGDELEALFTEWREGTAAKAAYRERVARLTYRTIVAVVTEAEAPDVMRALRTHPDVRFAASQEGVSPAAVAAGAEPGDWAI